jgi:glycosyltransferase involved in cell wall biosynthesis
VTTLRDGGPLSAVDFVVRSDMFTKPGGDTVQVEAYLRELEARGVDVRVVLYVPGDVPVRRHSVIHLFNVDQIYEFLDCMRQFSGRHVVVSPIHHSYQHLAAMRRAEPSTLRRFVSLLPEHWRALLVYAHGLRSRRDVSALTKTKTALWAVSASARARHRLGKALDTTQAVLLLGESERRALVNDFGWSGRNGVLAPNGIPTAMCDIRMERLSRILVIGRVEARKRQVELLEVAERMAVPLTFVGDLNPHQPAYGETFKQLIERSAQSSWLGRLPSDQVSKLMSASRVLLNASWAEVQSLVDIEAARHGCWVVTTEDGGASLEWLGEGVVHQFGAHDLEGAVFKADSLRRCDATPPTTLYSQTWRSTVAEIVQTYA